MMGRKDKSELRKPEILRHFFEVLKTEGIEGASIGKVAKHMDIHPSLIIHYFKTKENMVVELANYMLENEAKPRLSLMDDITDIEERMDVMLDLFLFRNEGRKDKDAIFPSIMYLAFRNREIGEKLKETFDFFHEYLVIELKKFMDHGIIKRDDPEKLASLLQLIGTGFKHHSILDEDFYTSDDFKKYIKESVLKVLE